MKRMSDELTEWYMHEPSLQMANNSTFSKHRRLSLHPTTTAAKKSQKVVESLIEIKVFLVLRLKEI